MEAVAQRYLVEQTTEQDAVWHLGLVAVVLDRAGRVRRVTVYPDLDSEPWSIQGCNFLNDQKLPAKALRRFANLRKAF